MLKALEKGEYDDEPKVAKETSVGLISNFTGQLKSEDKENDRRNRAIMIMGMNRHARRRIAKANGIKNIPGINRDHIVIQEAKKNKGKI